MEFSIGSQQYCDTPDRMRHGEDVNRTLVNRRQQKYDLRMIHGQDSGEHNQVGARPSNRWCTSGRAFHQSL